ncbi:hypothetical protein [Amycolatopsis sp. NPDC004079]|uniref:hypothetical protein n=1 Tax=Amycolatopsis sp. NPDC004079 TaxID=3154549 RepID=UPI0033A47B4B
MKDPYRFDDGVTRKHTTPDNRSVRQSGGGSVALRAGLWLLLVLSAAGNAVASLGSMDTLIRLAFGVVTVLCIIGLIVHHVRHR